MTAEAQQRAHAEPGAAYLSQLEIAGARCFGPSQTLRLERDGRPAKWTIVLGENGVGKTTLLQCAWAMAPYVPAVAPGALAGSHPRGLTAGILVDLQRSPGEALELGASVRLGSLLSSPDPGAPSASKLYARPDASGFVHGAGPYPEWANVLCCGYGALRRSSEAAVEATPQSHSSASLFSDGASLLSASEWFLRADYAAKSTEDERAQHRRDQVEAALTGGLLPDITALRVAGLDEDTPRPRVEVETPYGWVPIRSLGLGYRSMIAWVVDLASRMFEAFPASPRPLEEPAIALIDEIDLHLHPRWQREITGHLDVLLPNVQFIATAHSPLVVQGAGVTNVAVLRRCGDHVEIVNDPEQIRGWRVDQILTSDLFGLPSARSVEAERLFTRQRELVLLDDPTPAQRAELERIDAQLAAVTPGETAADRRTWATLSVMANRAGTGT